MPMIEVLWLIERSNDMFGLARMPSPKVTRRWPRSCSTACVLYAATGICPAEWTMRSLAELLGRQRWPTLLKSSRNRRTKAPPPKKKEHGQPQKKEQSLCMWACVLRNRRMRLKCRDYDWNSTTTTEMVRRSKKAAHPFLGHKAIIA